MDPLITVVALLDPLSPDKGQRSHALRVWYQTGGFHPKIADVYNACHDKPWFKFIKVGYLMDLGVNFT